ncbi:solute carrier family 5 member 3a [Alosa sapidissima]|uniref:solute carrier family 5 member 3a n=1 Tax=Alosa sapidissima TaxID=34773 RepID=UPI001C095443|nr:solute carrier family 5 member 3a [Alosa sapidissima]XP_041937377.1 solute carrier family 5 member 3a [Alosa sapidissima]
MAVMEAADIAVVALYFVLVMGFGIFAMWRANRSTVSGYFLAGRSMNWFVIGASLFVSNIGSEHFIGLAGSGAASGFSVGAWEFNALLLLQLLGWVFIPVYIHAGVYTMPEYLSKRFGGKRLKIYFAALSLILYIFTKLSVDLYSGALFIQESLGWNLYLSIILLITMTALLTITGGLAAVIYTDTLQAFLMIGGALCLSVIGLNKIGGLEELKVKYMLAKPNTDAIMSRMNITKNDTCAHHIHPKPHSLQVLRGPLDEDLPWPGFLLGQTPASLWYWCTDQVIVQRVLAAKNIAHAKGSTLMAGFLKILPMFIIVIPGMISRVLFADELACINPDHCMEVCGSPAGCSNIAYPRLVMSIMPVGLRGLMMAVMIAALMSDLDSIFNSASTIFTLDIYKMIRQHASSRELLVVGRLFVAFMVVISIAWVPVIIEMQGGQMFLYIQEVCDYLSPPIAALFLLAVLWKRCNETGAFWGGLVGFALGFSRLVLAFVYREGPCNEQDTRPAFIKDVHFMYVAAGLFWISGLVTVVVSLCTPPPSKDQILKTTFWGLHNRDECQITDPEEVLRLKGNAHVHCNGNSTPHKDLSVIKNETENIPNGETDHTKTLAYTGDNDDMASNTKMNGNALAIGNSHLDPVARSATRKVRGGLCGGGERGFCVRLLQWFCGFNGDPAKDGEKTQIDDKVDIEEMLSEPPRIKFFLNLGLLTVCSTGIFLFVYFSL